MVEGKGAASPYEILIFCAFLLIIQNLYGLNGKISIIVPYKLSSNLILLPVKLLSGSTTAYDPNLKTLSTQFRKWCGLPNLFQINTHI